MSKDQELCIEHEQSNDEIYLQGFVKSFYCNYPVDVIWAVKDSASQYVAASKSLAVRVGLTQQGMIGATELEFTSAAKDFYQLYYQQDRLVERTRSRLHVLDVQLFQGKLVAYLTHKFPIINPVNHNVLGSYFISMPLKINDMSHLLRSLYNADIHSDNVSPEFKRFSACEQEVLFCIALGMHKNCEIASFLSLIHSQEIRQDESIQKALRSIHTKLNNINVVAELAQLLSMPCDLEIPESLLKLGSYPIS